MGEERSARAGRPPFLGRASVGEEWFDFVVWSPVLRWALAAAEWIGLALWSAIPGRALVGEEWFDRVVWLPVLGRAAAVEAWVDGSCEVGCAAFLVAASSACVVRGEPLMPTGRVLRLAAAVGSGRRGIGCGGEHGGPA